MTIGILVCNLSRGLLFSAEKRNDDWSLLKSFEHPEGRELSSEISDSSPPGRMQKSKGAGTRSSMEPHTWPKEVEAERFAKLLAVHLDEAIAKSEFKAIVLVAPPHFLGLLHGTLGKQTAKHVQASIHKDLIMFDAVDIRHRLLDEVFPTSTSAN